MSTHIERVRDALEAAGIEVNEVRALPTGLGQQLRCAGGAVVSVYNTGKIVPQGKGAEAVKAALSGIEAPQKAAPKPTPRAAAPTLPINMPAASAPSGRLELWTNQPWDGVTMPWDPIS